MKTIKKILKNNPITRIPYEYMKSIKDARVNADLFRYKGHFDNRSRGHQKMCIILAGYKSFLYAPVFSRIKSYLPKDIDVCVVSSGVFSKKLSFLCKKNNWSYLSTKENNVGLVQNVAINLHPNAKYIYKLDEDIFVTEGYFERLFEAYLRAKEGDYKPGVMAPLLLINGFTSLMILDKLGIRQAFIDRFGPIKHEAGGLKLPAVESDSKVARFFWGEGGVVPPIDEINSLFYSQEFKETPCPIRFSIGAILFERDIWEQMHYFDVNRKDENMLGKDEAKLCEFCMINSFPIMVSENIAVGHFSFGSQTDGMKEYYLQHPDRFAFKGKLGIYSDHKNN